MSSNSLKTSFDEKPTASNDLEYEPKFIGLRGEKLNIAVSALAGVGFLLFGMYTEQSAQIKH